MRYSINYLWNHGSEANWLDALEQYDAVIHSRTPASQLLETYMGQLETENVKSLSTEAFYDFLHDQYFVWVFTQKNRLATTRKHLRKYVEENQLFELAAIQKKLFSTKHSNIKDCLTAAMEIRGLGVAGASGLLSVLFPQAFGGVNEYIVTLLRDVDGISYHCELSKMKPGFLTAKDGVVVTQIYREKANELNSRFGTEFWTPRKIDQVLWACER